MPTAARSDRSNQRSCTDRSGPAAEAETWTARTTAKILHFTTLRLDRAVAAAQNFRPLDLDSVVEWRQIWQYVVCRPSTDIGAL